MFANVVSHSHRTVALRPIRIWTSRCPNCGVFIDKYDERHFLHFNIHENIIIKNFTSSHDNSNDNPFKLSIFYKTIQLALNTIPIINQHITNQVKQKPIYTSFIHFLSTFLQNRFQICMIRFYGSIGV